MPDTEGPANVNPDAPGTSNPPTPASSTAPRRIARHPRHRDRARHPRNELTQDHPHAGLREPRRPAPVHGQPPGGTVAEQGSPRRGPDAPSAVVRRHRPRARVDHRLQRPRSAPHWSDPRRCCAVYQSVATACWAAARVTRQATQGGAVAGQDRRCPTPPSTAPASATATSPSSAVPSTTSTDGPENTTHTSSLTSRMKRQRQPSHIVAADYGTRPSAGRSPRQPRTMGARRRGLLFRP
ncbi:hypothetical protein ABH940_006852 [Streptacidiphilus sp. BW17]